MEMKADIILIWMQNLESTICQTDLSFTRITSREMLSTESIVIITRLLQHKKILEGENIYMPTEFLHAQDDGGGGTSLADYWELHWNSQKERAVFCGRL
jgi:hypothetical protein